MGGLACQSTTVWIQLYFVMLGFSLQFHHCVDTIVLCYVLCGGLACNSTTVWLQLYFVECYVGGLACNSTTVWMQLYFVEC